MSPPSMTAFGFTYDEDLVERLGGDLWPGVAHAERDVTKRAREDGITPAVLRARLQQRYQQNIELIKNSKAKRASAR